ncbi:UNVERIFIED_CONTAM: tight adherence protein C [Acetivibrio alkalicellulosi]
MIISFISILVVFLILYLLSKNKYTEYIEVLDKKEYKLKDLIPIGLFILDKINYKYISKYDRRLQRKISDLKGAKYSFFYLQIHWANKISFILFMMLITSFIGAAMGEVNIEYIVFALFLLIALAYFTDKELDNKLKLRKQSIQLDFPDFVNKLTLLINAGMTILKAWEKIVIDNKKDTVLYEELEYVIADIRAGKAEAMAYEDFAKRCRIPEITKFVAVILQNLRKGNAQLVSILRVQGADCWEMRKSAAKRLGEEASTKMLFPMMIMFLAVLLIVATPAVLAMSGVV